MKNISITFCIVFICFYTGFAFAQDSPLPPTIMEKPTKYVLPYNERDTAPSTDVLNYQGWIVYSDRENNVTYTEPGGSQEYGPLNFMEQFYVAEEKDDYVRLVRDLNLSGIELSENAIDFGWIKKDKLLIWNHCLVTPPDKGKINKKAMILNTLDHVKSHASSGGEPDKVKFRKGPEPDDPLSGKDSHLYQIFYVYKHEGDMVLLGKEERIDDANENTRRQNIVGWAPLSRLTPWDHRVALEPNWEPQAVSERKRGKKAKFFISVKAAKEYADGGNPNENYVFWDSDPLDERPIGEWRRFPFLKYSKEGIEVLIAGIMGEVHLIENGTITEKVVSSTDMADLIQKIDSKNAKKRFINIVFVVDGTTSMEPYFSPISNAVIQSMKKLQSKNTRNSFRFGAAVYRDWAEGRDRLIKTERLTDNHKKIAKFLKEFEAGDVNDKDQPEAVFFGLKSALRNVGLPQEETNVIVLIGDAGNHKRNDPSQVDSKQIVKLLVDKECHFLTFQVHHEANSAYTNFITQTRALIMAEAQEIYSKTTGSIPELSSTLERPNWEQEGSTYKLTNGATVGWVLSQKQGNKMNPSSLQKELEDFILAVDEINNRYVAAIQEIIDGGSLNKSIQNANSYEKGESSSKYVSSFAPGILYFLSNQGIEDKELDIIRTENFQLYTKGSAPKYVKGQKHPLFKEVLLLSRIELHRLWDAINRLVVAGSIDQQRDKMTVVWKELLKEHIGEVSNEQMETLSMEEIYEKVFGLPSTSDFLSNITLRDIQDRGKFKDKDFAEYVERIKSKDRELFQIINMEESEYKYCFRSNEQPYFWIPQDMLP